MIFCPFKSRIFTISPVTFPLWMFLEHIWKRFQVFPTILGKAGNALGLCHCL